MNTQAELKKLGIFPDPLKDQFFLQDETVIKRMVDLAQLNEYDTVLEIGAGPGNLTRELAKKAGKVIAFEIDPRFKPLLAKLPKNVETYLENAWDFVQLHGKFRKRKIYNKIVSNLPYSFCEQLFHNLTFLEFDKVVLLVPLKFLNTLSKHVIFASFLDFKLLETITKKSFYPQPRTNSALIEIISLPNPVFNKSLSLFLRQYIYQHEDQKVKNSIKEGLIKYANSALNLKLSQNEARKILLAADINTELLESDPNGEKVYQEITNKFSLLDLRHYSSTSS